MRPLERPKPTTPDVSAFQSQPDPADQDEIEVQEEEPYVPYLPPLPPRPVRFPGRRKLTDDIDKFQPVEFGAGVESSAPSSDPPDRAIESTDVTTDSFPRPSQRNRRNERPQRNEREDRGDTKRALGRPREPHNSATLAAPELKRLDGLPAIPVDTPVGLTISKPDSAEKDKSDGNREVAADQSTPENTLGDSRRRPRRRGRRGRRGQGPSVSGEQS